MTLSLQTPEGPTVELEKRVEVEVDATKEGSAPHRYTFLKVNEVSIVTEPAILSQEEADKGVGFPIVKFVEGAGPESTEKATLKAGEDILGWMERLSSEAKLNLSVALGDGDSYFFVPVKVFQDVVIMTDPYHNPLDKNAMFYSMGYEQDEAGKFTFSRPRKLKLTFSEEGITSEKIFEVVKELPMSQIKGVEIGGVITKITPIPGLSFETEEGALIFRCDDEGVLHAGDGYVIGDDDIVRKEAEVEETAEETPEAEVEAQKFYFNPDQLKALMASSGDSFSIRMTPEGTVELSERVQVSPQATVPMPEFATPEVDDSELQLRVKRLEEELALAKQRIAGSSTTDPEVGEEAAKALGQANFPVEKKHRPVDGKYEDGIFTRHIDKRLLGRRLRQRVEISE